MKVFGVLLLLAVAGCASSEEQVKNVSELPLNIPNEMIHTLIDELSNSSYTTIDKLFDKTSLFPYKYIGNFEDISNNITNYDPPTHKGKVLAYTNQYGILFFNDSEILFTANDIQKLPYSMFTAKNLLSGSDNYYDELMEFLLPISNTQILIKSFEQTLTNSAYARTHLEQIFLLLGIEYDWIETYFYTEPSIYYSGKSLWFSDDFRFILNSSTIKNMQIKSHILQNLLKNSQKPSVFLINGWLYFILNGNSPYYFDDDHNVKLLMSDEGPLK